MTDVKTSNFKVMPAFAAMLLALLAVTSPVSAQDAAGLPQQAATYADLTDLAERSDLVIRAEIRRQTVVNPERAPGLKPGFARLYIQAQTLSLIAGSAPVGESLVYLVDVPLDAKGKPPKLKKQEVLLLARSVPGRPGELQLVSESGQMLYSPELEQRMRPILADLVATDAPPIITGVSDALSVRGTLSGESETQIFLTTESGAPVSFTVLRRPRQPAVWGVSWGEIIDQAARPPQAETLAWYRLACALPRTLPSRANLAREQQVRRLAQQDYLFVIDQLGPCERNLTRADT